MQIEKIDGIVIDDTALITKIQKEYFEIFGVKKLITPIVEQHEKLSTGLNLVNDPINRFVVSFSQDLNSSFYDNAREKGIRTTPDLDSFQQFSGFGMNTLRTSKYYLEAASKLIERLKKWRNL